MDILASLNVDDLPEQQTRTNHLINDYPDFSFHLGFDVCCTCGTTITPINNTVCRTCQRVSYCSYACREIDANILNSIVEENHDNPDGIEAENNAFGHTSVICTLLNACNDDEAIDTNEGHTIVDVQRREAAIDRVRSEYESYPATLANVLLEGSCYEEILFQKQRQRTQQKSIGNSHNNNISNPDVFTIHVIGASEDAELSCGPTITFASSSSSSSSIRTKVCKDYAEALAELADKYKLQSIELVFIGPDCPIVPFNEVATMYYLDQNVGTVTLRSIRNLYTQDTLINETNTVDFVIMYNPGLTCPDYVHWKETIYDTIPNGTPFLIVTNTEMEAIADCQYLYDINQIQSLPPMIADIILDIVPTDNDRNEDDDEDVHNPMTNATTSFFSINPFCGNRVRQNGTMANDVFVKNRWMIGGILDSYQSSTTTNDNDLISKKKIKYNDTNVVNDNNNSKVTNPALI